jgi:hypothetical protein
VDLKINNSDGPITPNKDNGDNLDIAWNVTRNTTLGTTYCDKSGNTWGTGQLIPDKNLSDSNNDLLLPLGSYPIDNSEYKLTCYNGLADNSLNSDNAFDSVFVSVYCNASTTYAPCDKTCGPGHEQCTQKSNRCQTTSCANIDCNLGPCPIVPGYREVAP